MSNEEFEDRRERLKNAFLSMNQNLSAILKLTIEQRQILQTMLDCLDKNYPN